MYNLDLPTTMSLPHIHIPNPKHLTHVFYDVYKSILPPNIDYGEDEQGASPRKGFLEHLINTKNKRIQRICASDAYITNAKIDLQAAGIDLELFSTYVRFGEGDILAPKPFKDYLEAKHIAPSNTLIIGDSAIKDIRGAIEAGCAYVHIPPYLDAQSKDDFDYTIIDDYL